MQYQIEHGPQTDILKYDVKKYVQNKKTNKMTKTAKFSSLKYSNNQDYDDLSEEELDDETYTPRRVESTVNVDIDDLIDQHLIKMVEKKSLEELKSRSVEPNEEVELERKDRKVYIERSSESDSSEDGTIGKQVTRKTAKPVEVNLDIFDVGTEVETLKAKYGKRYAEAHLCWPRMFAINFDEQLRERLLKTNSVSKDFDVVMWLRFAQVSKSIGNSDWSPFKVIHN